jgi:hypothetical protein
VSISFIKYFNEFTGRILLIWDNVMPISRILIEVFSREKQVELDAKSEKIIEIMWYFVLMFTLVKIPFPEDLVFSVA